METSFVVVLKNSSTKSSLANLGSLTPADLAIKFDGVVVSCNAKQRGNWCSCFGSLWFENQRFGW